MQRTKAEVHVQSEGWGRARRKVAGGLGASLTAFAIVFGALAGCSNSAGTPSDTSEVSRAASLIDQKQYSEAIYVLDEHMKTMPGDAHARVLLASAYASRAGLQLGVYEAFGMDLAKWDQIDRLVPVDNDGTVLGQVSAIANAAVKVDLVIRAFHDLPDPTGPEGIKDLQAAVDILNDGGELHGGPSLYRALLKTVVFKFDLAHGYKQELLNPPGQSQTVVCQVMSGNLAKWFASIGGDLDAILGDAKNGLAEGDAMKRVADVQTQLQQDIKVASSILTLPKTAKDMNLPPALQQIYGTCQP